jgi:hypothetical protein
MNWVKWKEGEEKGWMVTHPSSFFVSYESQPIQLQRRGRMKIIGRFEN